MNASDNSFSRGKGGTRSVEIEERTSVFGWDGDGGLGERLIRQILDGTKTATCSLKIELTQEELAELYAGRGRLATVVNWRQEPRCTIRILDVFETTFGDPDPRLVRGEGDGEDADKFRRDHALAWEATLPGVPLTDETVLVVELFELVPD